MDIKLTLKRIALQNNYTIGKLLINGDYFCDVLEDKVRGLSSDMTAEQIAKIKVHSQTAIPIGTYKITLTYSNRFKKILPLLNDVPGFEGIRIHSGNTSADTEGCLLVGQNKVKGQVINSRDTFNKLMSKIQDAKSIIITIVE